MDLLAQAAHQFAGLFHLAADCQTETGILPGLYDGVCPNGSEVELTSVADALKIVWNILRILIAFSGMLAVILIIVASIYYIISAGDPAQVKKAKDTLNNLVVGLILIISSYAVVTFISKGF